MERGHRKSALAETNRLILAAHDLGEGLLWARYEKQLPLCAFSGSGLNCKKCFQGPCRINPFGDEPDRGICGADRDQIVMENLFQATLGGVLETARSFSFMRGGTAAEGFPEIESGLPRETRKRLSEMGIFPVGKEDLFEVENSYFSHKGFLSETLKDLTRLGLIHYAFLREGEASVAKAHAENSPFRSNGINLLIVGQAPVDLVRNLEEQALRKAGGRKVNLLAQGTYQLPFLKAAVDHGSPEMALGMDLDGLLVSPNASLPSLEELAKRYDLPVILLEGKKSLTQIASEAIEKALLHIRNTSSGDSVRMTPAGDSEGRQGAIWENGSGLRKAFQSEKVRGLVVLFGEPNARETFYQRTLALMEASLAERCIVLVGGDLSAGVDLLTAEIRRRRPDQLSSFSSEIEKNGLFPFYPLGSFEVPQVVSLTRDLAGEKAVHEVPILISFPEFYRTSTWATAVTFLSLGFTVQIGARLPFWGSPSLAEVLLKDWPEMTGGKWLASPALPEERIQAEEMIAYLKSRRIR